MFAIKKMVFAITLTTLPMVSSHAAEFSKPEIYGFISAGALKIDNQDLEAEAFEIELGLKGKAQVQDLNLLYQLEVDLASAANRADSGDPGKDGEDDIHVKEAVFNATRALREYENWGCRPEVDLADANREHAIRNGHQQAAVFWAEVVKFCKAKERLGPGLVIHIEPYPLG